MTASVRALLLALVLLAGGGCATTHAIKQAGTDVSAAAQGVAGVAQSIKSLAQNIERHVIDAPADPEIDGTEHQATPIDVILKAAPTITVDVFAVINAPRAAWRQYKEARDKAVAP